MTRAFPHIWQFSECVPADRVKRLLSHTSFEEVIGFLDKAAVVAFAWEPFHNQRLKGCHRASFLLEVLEHVYDAFFNSPVGYRSQYAASISTGDAANRQLLTRLEPTLLHFARPRNVVPEVRVQASLHATDAKVWIYEPEVQAQLGGETASLTYAPWQQASTDGAGLLAPVGTRLEVKGGWLDGSWNERRDPFKATRSNDIHCVGFS